MREIAMVEIEEAGLGPYPAVVERSGPLEPRFNRSTVERICRDSRSWMNHDVPGEGEYARLDGQFLEFFRTVPGPDGERPEVTFAVTADDDGRFAVPWEVWTWQVVTGSRGQVWACCVSPFGPVCGHQAEPADDDHQECVKCLDRVYTLSSRFWCDGCEAEEEQAVLAP